MVHARDILFWWTGRMLMLGLYRTGQVPFHTVYLTGMILAEDGTKMSKSKGNTVFPQDLIDQYGADALRLWYYTDALPGANAPIRPEKIKGNRNLVNKIWNASRFILLNINNLDIEEVKKKMQELQGNPNNYIKRLHESMKKMKRYYTEFKFNLAAEAAREFFRHDFADVWIEDHKQAIWGNDVSEDERIESMATLLLGLTQSLIAMHPMMPFITEAVWQELKKIGIVNGYLIQQQWDE